LKNISLTTVKKEIKMNKIEQAMDDHKKGNWEQAENAYKEIIAEEPENADVMYLLAVLQRSQQKLEESLISIDKAIQTNKEAPAFLQLKGSILARLGRGDEAVVVLNKAIEKNPNLYQAQVSLGHLYYLKGDKNKAEKHFSSALKVDEEQIEAHVNLARLWIDEGKIEKAIGTLKKIEEKHPEQGSIKMLIADAFLESGGYSVAEDYYKKVLAMHPENDLAGLYLGIARIKTGDSESAEKLIIAYNSQYTNTREGTAALGLLFYEKNNFRMALEYLRRAISAGIAPLSWKLAFVESLAKLGQPDSAISFYKESNTPLIDKTKTYRLGELYELKGETKKAKQKYKKVKNNNSKYLASLLGITRCYLQEEKFEKAEKNIKEVLSIRPEHAEATLLYITALLFQDKIEKALKKLEKLDYKNLADVYKKTFRLQHGLILDKLQKYKKAMKVFKDKSKQQEIPPQRVEMLTEEEIKQTQEMSSSVKDELKDPVFIVGLQSTGINNFVTWLNKEKVIVLNDRLISLGRPDVLYAKLDILELAKLNDDGIEVERQKYHSAANPLKTGVDKDVLFADCMYLNPNQLTTIKKIFPKAKVILLTRNEKDIQLNQKVFGEEPIPSSQWKKTMEQVNSLGMNIIEVDADKWLENDKETMDKLETVFEKKLKKTKENQQKYWRKTLFPKNHWKNYKNLLDN
jgi:tetratricopeptide (TPR) repeat protein